MPSFTSTLKKEMLSMKLIIGTLLIGLLYLSISVLLVNRQLFQSLVGQEKPLAEIISLFFTLFGGLWTSLSVLDFFLTLISALFVGFNIMLLIRTMSVIGHKGKIHVSIGGATLVSLVATGCASCGLSLLSVLGLSASLSFLPFHGLLLHIGAIVLLIISCIYMLQQLHNGIYCKIERR